MCLRILVRFSLLLYCKYDVTDNGIRSSGINIRY